MTTAFKAYDGTLCFISHDLYFIKEIATSIVDVQGGGVKSYPGGLDYYLEKKEQREEEVKEQKRQAKQEEQKAQREKAGDGKERMSPALRQLHDQHKKALQRINEIKNEIKRLEEEQKELETESYVKSRHLSKQFDKQDPQTLKEYGQRLKYIQGRLREIETMVGQLKEERDRISK